MNMNIIKTLALIPGAAIVHGIWALTIGPATVELTMMQAALATIQFACIGIWIYKF
jgi:hypothetical protein